VESLEKDNTSARDHETAWVVRLGRRRLTGSALATASPDHSRYTIAVLLIALVAILIGFCRPVSNPLQEAMFIIVNACPATDARPGYPPRDDPRSSDQRRSTDQRHSSDWNFSNYS
jgi:hypothetical protein